RHSCRTRRPRVPRDLARTGGTRRCGDGPRPPHSPRSRPGPRTWCFARAPPAPPAPSRAARSPRLSQPRTLGLGLPLLARDLRGLDHGERDVVEPIEQAMLAERVDVEPHHPAVATAHLLLVEIEARRGIAA